MAPILSRSRQMTWKTACVAALVLFSISCMSLVVFCGMTFQPGWANDWPMRISKHTVFSLYVTIMFAIISISFTAAVLVIPCHFGERMVGKPFVGWAFFIFLLCIVGGTVLVVCPDVYRMVHASIAREWQ